MREPSASSFNLNKGIVTVSEHRKNNRSSKLSRRSRIDHADRLFALGKGFAAKATSSGPYWWRAATTFANAADHYRRANLGLMAKVAYRHASHCFAKGGSAGEASRSGALADAFPVFWEEEADDE